MISRLTRLLLFQAFTLVMLAALFVGTLGDQVGLDMTFKISAGLAFLSIPFVLLLPGPGSTPPASEESGNQ